MSLKTNDEILRRFTLWSRANLTLANYRTIFTDPAWYSGYINSIIYVAINTVISLAVALPAAYAFSRYRFIGDKHLFFWLLDQPHGAAGGVPAAVLPALLGVGLFDTHIAVALAHCLFNVPLAVWILEGFMSRRPAGDRRDRLHRRLLVPALLREDLPAADRAAASASPRSSASCSAGSSCCSRAR